MKRMMLLGAAVVMTSTAVIRAQTPVSSACTNATLTGSYGVSISGTRPAPSILPNLAFFLPGATEQAIGVVIQTFDGSGKFTQTDNVKGSLSGITPNRPGSGIYSVNSDCTGTYTVNNAGVPFPIVTQMVIVDSGAEFRGIVLSPQPVMITANGRKMN